MQVANKSDRIKLVAEMVEKGQTTDESREAQKQENRRWIICVDVSYHLTSKWAAGAGPEAAMTVAQWVQRTVERLKQKGVTDCVCCFDSPRSFRKELTADWGDGERYKEKRIEKDPEHAQQLKLVEELLRGHGFCCASADGYEADDLLASYAAQFDGDVTLLTVDKDARGLLSKNCNMLLDIERVRDENTGEISTNYKWVSAKSHTEGCTYNSAKVEGVPPDKWWEFQTLAGDPVDNVRGSEKIGAKTAADLIKEFGSCEAAIKAAKEEDERIKSAKRESLIAFEPKLETTRQLVTLRRDLELPSNTRI